MSDYSAAYAAWQADPGAFWMQAAQGIDWDTAPSHAFAPKAGVYGRWFPDAVGNTCYNAIDRHVAAGRGNQAAIIYASSMRRLTWPRASLRPA